MTYLSAELDPDQYFLYPAKFCSYFLNYTTIHRPQKYFSHATQKEAWIQSMVRWSAHIHELLSERR